jgi:Xylose isomerase-like TIM barrel
MAVCPDDYPVEECQTPPPTARDLDGLAAPQGRVFDGSLKARYQLTRKVDLSFGYRTLEGGADAADVYSCGWLHYGVASLVEECVKEYDVKVALHNHGPEDPHFPTAKSVLTAIQGLDPRVGLCIDIGHSARTGEDVVAAIRAAGPRLLDFDAKDLSRKMEVSSQCDVGDGELPIAAMFRELLKLKYAGVVLAHARHHRGPEGVVGVRRETRIPPHCGGIRVSHLTPVRRRWGTGRTSGIPLSAVPWLSMGLRVP